MSHDVKNLECIFTFKPSDDSGDIDVPLSISREEHYQQIILRVVHKAHLDHRKQYHLKYTNWKEGDEGQHDAAKAPCRRGGGRRVRSEDD